ncbi:MAG: SET domain-containing protein [Minisyncoccia bacterium]
MARSRYIPGDFKLHVKKSKSGKGLFAQEKIPKGACVVEYVGRSVSEAEADRDRGKYLFEIAKGKTIDGNVPGNLARYINHSCAPNCEAIGPPRRVFIFSMRRIKPGEELTYDYGTEYFDRHIKPRGCRCGKCLPPKTRQNKE